LSIVEILVFAPIHIGENPNGENPKAIKGTKRNGENPKAINGENPKAINGENPNGENPNGENPNGENPKAPNGAKENVVVIELDAAETKEFPFALMAYTV
jgi:hypothetical protein